MEGYGEIPEAFTTSVAESIKLIYLFIDPCDGSLLILAIRFKEPSYL